MTPIPMARKVMTSGTVLRGREMLQARKRNIPITQNKKRMKKTNVIEGRGKGTGFERFGGKESEADGSSSTRTYYVWSTEVLAATTKALRTPYCC